MKRTILLAGLTMLMLTLLNACGKDDKDGNGGATGKVENNYFEVKINGNKRVFSDVEGRWVDGGNFLEINATNEGNEWVTITVMSDVTRIPAGVYELDDNSPFTILATYSLIGESTQDNFSATRGTYAPEDNFTLNLSKVDNSEVEGTFSGGLVIVEGYNTLKTVSFTEGKFKTSILPN